MTLMEHLGELRLRIVVSLAAIAVGAVVCWFAYPVILEFLLEPYCRSLPASNQSSGSASQIFGSECQLYARNPFEPFSVRLSVAGYGGIIASMPVLLWQFWRFVAPGLFSHERKLALAFIGSGVLLFFAGGALAYWSIPRALAFLSQLGGENLVEWYGPADYLGFVIKMIIAFGIGFEFPIVLIGLQVLGLVENSTLRRGRRYAIVGVVALVAVLTPSGDPFTLAVLSVPMYLFYEIAILFGRIRKRRRARGSKLDQAQGRPKLNDS